MTLPTLKTATLSVLLSAAATAATAQEANPVKVNQVGYYPQGQKTAVVEKEAMSSKYTITDAAGRTVWRGKASRTTTSPLSGKRRSIVDFSSLTTPGTYTLKAGRYSQPITITPQAFHDVAVSTLHAFYLQRTGEPILKEYAGEYARPLAHADNQVMIHPSAASPGRPAGTIIRSAGGWYDAGDYNKYIVNSAYSIGIMLYAYERSMASASQLNLNIPESNNATPDVLDEIMCNLQWMQTMQDPGDGGVYHKLTTPSFEAFIMPADCKQQRYVVAKGTAATLDFAATMAQASRIYGQLPQFKAWAAVALEQARQAYAWAERNPSVVYSQRTINASHEPAISTGEYGDRQFADEWAWASAELLLATGDSHYRHPELMKLQRYDVGSWGNVTALATYALINGELSGQLTGSRAIDISALKQSLIDVAKARTSQVASSAFQAPFGNTVGDFQWGSNSMCAALGVAMLYAHKLTGEQQYLNGALQCADYMLGRNATGYCYVTGHGTHSPQHPHQRLSHADGIDKPLPGFLVGGPNPGHQDKNDGVTYKTSIPDESYEDVMPSYASNEIAINWNASIAALLMWLEAEM